MRLMQPKHIVLRLMPPKAIFKGQTWQCEDLNISLKEACQAIEEQIRGVSCVAKVEGVAEGFIVE